MKGRFRITTYKAGTKKVLRRTGWNENLVVLNEGRGMNIVVKRILGITTYDLVITQAKIGDDDTSPTDNDIDLGNTILDGILVATATETSTSKATLEFFIADAELPEGNYKEFGIFCEEQLFARGIISPTYSKSTGEDTKVEYEIIVNNT